MKIAIFDIDDTIVEETGFMLKKAQKYLHEKHNIDAEIVNPNGYDVKEVFGLVERLKKQGYSEEEAQEKSRKINQSFWNDNFVKYCQSPLKNGVRETVDILRKNGYKIMFISLRGKTTSKQSTFIDDFIRLKVVPFLTASQLTKGKISYDELRLVKTPQEKIELINSLNPNFVFEDQPEIIRQLNIDGKKICMGTSHNQSEIFSDDILMLNEFDIEQIEDIIAEDTLEETKKIKRKSLLQRGVVKDLSIKNPVYLRKILTEATYSLVSKAGRPVIKSIYKPIIKGQKNIPKTGAVAFSGNHRDKMDPVIVGVTANRNIHWGALLRMFQGKENLFSSGKNPIPCYLSAAFITAMGTVPIARNTDKDYMKINLESMKLLYQFMQWQGATGLFPEGTLNRKPDEQNILPLKSDRVFKMAADMNGIIQPFSVVWIPENIDVPNRVIINYGLPINSRNKTSKELSEIWQCTVNEGIEDAKKLIEEMANIDRQETSKEEKSKKIKVLVKEFVNN